MNGDWLGLLYGVLWIAGCAAWGWLAWYVDNHLAPYSEDELGGDARVWHGDPLSDVMMCYLIPISWLALPIGLPLRLAQVAWYSRPDAVRERAQTRLDELLMPNAEPEGVVAWTRRERAALGLDDTDAWLARTDRLLS